MKIGIYSDVHISRTSSILPLYLMDKSKYTLRLENCINSMNEMYKTFEDKKVDMIINCGDTFDAHTIPADVMSAYLDINRCCNCKEQIIVGNHDKYNDTFNSIKLGVLFENVDVVDKYNVYQFDEADVDLYEVAYFEPKTFNKLLDDMMRQYPKKHKKSILFMHGDIDGSLLFGNLRVENQISKSKLIQYFDLVINGHIHCNETIYNKNDKRIINIGSLTTHSFADSNNHIGCYYILNTDDMSIESFTSKDQVLFRTYNINNKNDINDFIDKLDENTFKKIVKIKCPYELKDNIENICLDDKYNIIKYKFIFIYDSNNETSDEEINASKININDNVLIEDKFLNFIKTQDSLKWPCEAYENIIKE